jgi:anti-anti-sigma factor
MPLTPGPRLQAVLTAEGTMISLVGCAQLNEQLTQEVRTELLQFITAPAMGKVFLSLTGVDYLTSTMLAVLIMIHKRVQQRGGQLIVCDVAPPIYEIFEVTKVTTLFEVRQAQPPDPGPSQG